MNEKKITESYETFIGVNVGHRAEWLTRQLMIYPVGHLKCTIVSHLRPKLLVKRRCLEWTNASEGLIHN